MLWLPPMTMSLQPTLPACVIDTPLALSPYGLVTALRLAHTTRVWLSPTLWSIIEDHQFYLTHAAFVASLSEGNGTSDMEANRTRLARIIEHWRKARDQLGLEMRERIFWPGEKQSEAVMPKGGDAHLIKRLDALATQLDRKWQCSRQAGAEQVDILADCARDTIALAASLAEERPLVLTTRPADGTAPELGVYLNESGIPCKHLDDLTSLRLLRNAIAPLLIAAGLVETAAASGMRLAAVSLVTSGAPLLMEELADEDVIEDEVMSAVPIGELSWDASRNHETSLWDGAAAAWYELP